MTSKQHHRQNAQKQHEPKKDNSLTLPVVGIGASAGGIEALKKFFLALPPDSGMTFVVVQHLTPNHKSSMAELLSYCTSMPVHQVENNMELLADHVYIIPPHKNLFLKDYTLRLEDFSEDRGLRLPIDFLFRSLAATQGDKSIGVILSGTGADGTLGMKAIKAESGMVMVQKPEEAGHDGMPQSAIDTGLVDFILPVAKMPMALLHFVRHSYFRKNSAAIISVVDDEMELAKILTLLKEKSLFDFSSYKQGTVFRRIERRMGIHHMNSLQQYRRKLELDRDELEALSKDLLIIVTGFFRDPMAFEVLEKEIVSTICRKADSVGPIRVWIPGSATGEEAYSIAILFFEAFSRLGKENCQLQIFATDISRQALELARKAVFPQTIQMDVSPRRLQRFFDSLDNKYRVKGFVRDSIIFSTQHLLTDPPFSKIDLISCRNLLIYLTTEAQRRVISLFHFALKPHCYLFLGNAEGIGRNSELFLRINKNFRIYQKQNAVCPALLDFPTGSVNRDNSPENCKTAKPGAGLKELAERTMLQHFCPCGVVINAQYEILHYLGNTDNFLKIPEGEPTMNLMAMTPTAIRLPLRSLLHKIDTSNDRQAQTALVLLEKEAQTHRNIQLGVRRIDTGAQKKTLYLVTCMELPEIMDKPTKTSAHTVCSDTHEQIIRQLESELKINREDLEKTIVQMEEANQELKASNEEAMSMNEEFQSTNEELETSKEELITVNSQLLGKINELEQMTNDLNNLLASSETGTLFLDSDLRIKRFTPTIQKLFYLLPSDIDRPLQDFKSNFNIRILVEDVSRVMDTITPLEKEVRSAEGRWYLQKIIPYLTKERRVDGVVVTFTDINSVKTMEMEAERRAAFLQMITDIQPARMAYVDNRQFFQYVNESYLECMMLPREQVLGSKVKKILGPLVYKEIAPYISKVLSGRKVHFETVFNCQKDGQRHIMVDYTPNIDSEGNVVGFFVLDIDITDRKKLEKELQALNLSLESKIIERTAELEEKMLQLRKLAQELIQTEQRERERLAIALHNDMQQLLVAGKLRIERLIGKLKSDENINELGHIFTILEQLTASARRLASELQPPIVHLGPVGKMHWVAEWFLEKFNLEVQLNIGKNLKKAEIPDEINVYLFESAKELLFNIVKHAETDTASLALDIDDNECLHLRVSDNGRGTDINVLHIQENEKRGLGLRSINDRLRPMGGDFTIESSEGKGFRVDIRLPYSEDSKVIRSPQIQEKPETKTQSTLLQKTRYQGKERQKITILLADDHIIVRDGLRLILQEEDDMRIIGEASSGREAVELTSALSPDICILDINMPDMNGIEATRLITEKTPDARVIGLSIKDDPATVRAMINAGALAYHRKNDPSEEICRTIRDCMKKK